MSWKLFKFLRWSTDATKPALNTAGAAMFSMDTKRLNINIGTGWFGADTPPVGATYIQFPGKSDPATLWPNTTWSNISSETLLKGRVPRIEGTVPSGGGNASAAFGSVQDDQMQQITGSLNYLVDVAAAGGAFTMSASWAQGLWASGSAPRSRTANFDSAGSPDARTGEATRDASVTVRVWQRTN